MEEEVYSAGSISQNVSTTSSFVIVSSTTSVLSMLGTLLIFITYFTWKEIRTSSRQILLFISIADFFTALGNMFSVVHDEESIPVCRIQSFITTTSNLCSFFWTTFMSVYLTVTIAMRKPVLAERLLCAFHFFAWGVPFAITGVAFGYDVLGNDRDLFSAGWCWIKKMDRQQKQIMWMWFTGKAWEIATYVLIAVFYAVLKWYIRQDIRYKCEQFTTITARQVAAKADRKLTFVPLVFILCRIWGTVRFLLYVCNVTNEKEWLVYLQGIGDNAQGFANFMLFCFFTEKFQKKFKQVCCPCIKSELTKKTSPHNSHDQRPRASINERTSLLSSTKSNGKDSQ